MRMKICCWCKKEVSVSDKIRRDEVCPFCKNDIHSCVNCKFHDEGKHNKCSEPNSEWVNDREKRNYCDYFVFRDSVKTEYEKDKARKKIETLFSPVKKKDI